MENASKALIMAGGILIGILILTLMITLFINARQVSTGYESQKKAEAIQQFNTNFTQYLGRDVTIHEVVTICNFAKLENNKIKKVTVSPELTEENLKTAAERIRNIQKNQYQNDKLEIVYRQMNITYDETGYIQSITFSGQTYKVTQRSTEGTTVIYPRIS